MNPSPPVVGIPACIKLLEGQSFHAVGHKYICAAAVSAGCYPILLPALGSHPECASGLDLVHGILLTGSASNVSPSLYGQTLANPALPLDPARDASVFPLIRAALDRGMPILGICRGFQELNVAFGGTLHQEVHALPGMLDHRADKAADIEGQYGPSHKVSVAPEGILSELLGRAEQLEVNSVHGQGIEKLGIGLKAEATAPDGLIEAISVVGARGFTLAVQWHPEWRADENPSSRAIFQAFGRACSRYAAGKIAALESEKVK